MDYFGNEISIKNLPQHVAIIMDGNGRWAKERGMDRIHGHEKGYLVLKKIIDFNKNLGIPYISVYAFSTENWNRPPEEVNFLMGLAKNLVLEYTETLIKNDVRLVITGTEENLSSELISMLNESVKRTSRCSSYTLIIAFNYGGKREILDAAKKMAREYKSDKIVLDEFKEKDFDQYLYHPEIPEVDLMIRTSGELRTSNFFIWEAAYAEFWVTKKYWPDFKPKDLCKAVSDYQNRKRRFGGV